MDSYQAQQQYMRPTRPQPQPTADPYHYQQQQQQQPMSQWYSNQWGQPPPHQWAPPPPQGDHLRPPGSYPPPPHPYPNHLPPPPPPPQSQPHVPSNLPPPPPLPPPHNQEWGAPNWPNHQGWNYPVHNNQEDWEAKARAWADSRVAMENQHQQLQFPLPGRLGEQSHYHDQYPQNVDPHHSGAQRVPDSGTPTQYPPRNHAQDTSSVGSELSSYDHYAVRDGAPAGDPNVAFHRQGNLSTSPSVHQQEVPYSYSSVTGNENTAAHYDGQHHMQPSQPLPFTYGNQSADPATNLADQPLEFAPGFNADHGPQMQSSYAYHDSLGNSVDPATAVPSMNAWTSTVAPGVGYPPSLSAPSGQQDPSMVYSPVPGHLPTSFGCFPGMSLQPTIPTAGAPFAHTAGTAVHPTVAFPADAYGLSTVSDRPKKAAVPNWLREEIKKAVITNAPVDQPKEETQSTEDEGVDRSLGKDDQADSKSIDSSRSNEEEDDEDQVEAARAAAINQQIKRILTEVLSKVTDELFDEIATKVLTEDDSTVEVDQSTLTTSNKVLPSPPAFSVPKAPKASAKVLIPGKAKESETRDVNSKSNSTLPGDLLGLANYATDDDDDDNYDGPDGIIRSSGMPNSGKDVILQQSSVRNPSKDSHDATANDSSAVELEAHSRSQTIMARDLGITSSHESKYDNGAAISDVNYSRHKNDASGAEKNLPGSSSSELMDAVGTLKPELTKENVTVKRTSKDDLQGRESRMRPDKHDQLESKKSSEKDLDKEVESGRIRKVEKGDGKRRGQDERHSRNERTDNRNGSKEKLKEYGEKAQESESRKRSSHGDVKEDRTETDKLRRASAKEDANRKREHTKDKEDDRSRHRNTSDSSRHKRRRSPSVGSRGRNGKEDSVNHSNDSSDESSDDSKRKVHSRRHNSSPSPIRSRKRQVSRSPHSKHSQRRHSPYSSIDTNNRGRRSRSRSPARRKK